MIILISERAGIISVLLIIILATGMTRKCMFMTNAVAIAKDALARWKKMLRTV